MVLNLKNIIIFIILVLFSIPYVYYFIKYSKSGLKKKKVKNTYKKESFLKRIFLDIPKCFVYDILTRDPEYFPEFGVHIIAGKQGCGKTLTMTYLLEQYKKKYPKIKIKTNYCYSGEDSSITSWKDIVSSSNGVYGEIDSIDELQNWFSSQQSKDFPPEMLQEITQQRKQRKIVLGTSQVFNRLSKQLREQTYLLYEPHTFLNCITVVLKFDPIIKADSAVTTEKKFRGCFFFVHNEKLRGSYDTYKKIQTLAKDGFIQSPLNTTETNINIKVEEKRKGKK